MQSVNLSTIGMYYVLDLAGNLARYSVMAGSFYFIFWYWKREIFQKRRTQQNFPKMESIFRELKWSLSTLFVFSAVGVSIFLLRDSGRSQIYEHVSEYGWPYFFLSIALLMVAHDTYFYWIHRLMHHPLLFFRIHRVHHLSTNPSPWAAYAFHPLEAVLEAAFLPTLILLFPVHVGAIIAFVIFDMAINVLGHLGYELYPSGSTRHRLVGLLNTPTHHNMHHQYFSSNFGLYFNVWDRICGTNHPKYHETFESVAKGQSEIETSRRKRPSLPDFGHSHRISRNCP
jgi:Delta7-sterol 5-desaturase